MSKKYFFDQILWEKENIDAGWIGLTRRPTLVRRRFWVYPKANSVTVRCSLYYMGKTANDKVYARWTHDSAWGIRRTKTGKYVPFSTNRSGKFMSGISQINVLWDNNIPPEGRNFIYTAFALIGVRTVGDVYPALRIFAPQPILEREWHLKNFGDTQLMRHKIGNRKHSRRFYASLHNDDPRAFVEHITNHKYRKDILRGLQGRSFTVLSSIHHLGLIDSSWAGELVKKDRSDGELVKSLQNLAILSRMHKNGELTDATYRRFVLGPSPDSSMHANDARRMVNRMYADHKVRKEFYRQFATLNEAHDAAMQAHNVMFPPRVGIFGDDIWNVDYVARAKTDLTKPIEYDDKVKVLDGATVNDYTIMLPKTAQEIAEWSPLMRHCIGSYAEEAYKGEVLGAVMLGEKMVANFHLARPVGSEFSINADGHDLLTLKRKQNLAMIQIYAKANTMFKDADKIYDFMVQAGVIKKSGYVAGIERNIGREILAGAVRAVENDDRYADYRNFMMNQQRDIERAGADAYVQFDIPARNLGGLRLQNEIPARNFEYIREDYIRQVDLPALQVENIF